MLKKFTKTLTILCLLGMATFATAQVTPLDFECDAAAYTTIGFGDVTGGVIANPDMSGSNTSAQVVHTNKAETSPVWGGMSIPVLAPMDFSASSMVTLQVWSPNAGDTILFKLEELDGGNNVLNAAELKVVTTTAMTWETLTYDMSAAAGFDAAIAYNQAIVFPDFGRLGVAGGADYYFDDIAITLEPAKLPTLPLDFEACGLGYNPAGFGNAVAALIPNPNNDADNSSATVLNIIKPLGAEVWAGTAIDLVSTIDFTASTIVSVKFWSDFAGIPVRFKVEEIADATVFAEVDATTTVDGGWETLTFDMATAATFDASANYGKVVLFPDFGNTPLLNDLSFFFDDLQQEITALVKPTLPVDFEDDNLDWGFFGFGNIIDIERTANPDMSGENTSATVLRINKPTGSEVWAGIFFDLQGPVDLSNPEFTLKVWTPAANTPINLKMENSADNTIASEVIVNSTVGGAWETLTFDMSTAATFDAGHSYDRMVIFPNFNTSGADVDYYFDDLTGGDPVAETLPTIPIDFESSTLTYTLFPFGNDTAAVVANPDMSGENTSATVLTIFKPEDAETWAGVAMPLQNIVDLSAGGVFSVKVWSPDANVPFLLKMEDTTSPPDGNGNPSIISEVFVSTTVAGAWETLVFDMTTFAGYDATHQYNQIVLFANMNNPGNPGGTSYYVDDIQPNGVVNPITLPTIPVDFEQAGITYTLAGFGGVDPVMIANPDMSGINTSANVVQLTKTDGAEVWGGVAIPLENAIDLNTATGSTFSVDVWSPRAGVPVLLKFEDLADPTVIFVELQQSTTVANSWETVVFDMSTGTGWDATAQYNQVVVFPDFGTAGMGENFYIDNINNAGPTSISKVDLAKVKVNAFPNPVDEVLNVQITIPVSGQLTIDVIDVLGRNVSQLNLGNLTEGNYTDELNLSSLNTGNYFMVTRLDGTIISTKNISVK